MTKLFTIVLSFVFAFVGISWLQVAESKLAADENKKSAANMSGTMPPKERERYEKYVRQVHEKIRTKLNLYKLNSESAKRNLNDVFVIAKLSGSPETREIVASFETLSGVHHGAEQLLEYLKATPNTEVRDFRVISRHSSSSEAETTLAQISGRETEFADSIKQAIVRKEMLYAQRLAQAQARAAYLAQLRARSRGNSGRRTSFGGSGRC